MAAEQVALRRVATLVASGASPPAVFCAIAEEVAQLFGASVTLVLRFEGDGTATVVGGWCEAGLDIPVGTRLTVEGEGVATTVRRMGRPAVTDCFDGPPGSIPARLRSVGARAGVGSPIIVEGRLWGVAVAAASCPELLPVGSEVRVDDFTALVGTAIASAQARAELRGIADEQAALRRVATLVAEAAQPADVFAAVAEQVGGLVPADLTLISRFVGDGAVTGVAGWSSAGETVSVSAARSGWAAETSRRACSRAVGRRGSTPTRTPPGVSPSRHARWTSGHRLACPSDSVAVCGAS
jgi:GAF domain-containing protein